jgi:hypothetical protein
MSLSDDQKEALRQTRLARGHVPNGNKGKTVNNGTTRNKAVIAALTTRLDALVMAKAMNVRGPLKARVNITMMPCDSGLLALANKIFQP